MTLATCLISSGVVGDLKALSLVLTPKDLRPLNRLEFRVEALFTGSLLGALDGIFFDVSGLSTFFDASDLSTVLFAGFPSGDFTVLPGLTVALFGLLPGLSVGAGGFSTAFTGVFSLVRGKRGAAGFSGSVFTSAFGGVGLRIFSLGSGLEASSLVGSGLESALEGSGLELSPFLVSFFFLVFRALVGSSGSGVVDEAPERNGEQKIFKSLTVSHIIFHIVDSTASDRGG